MKKMKLNIQQFASIGLKRFRFGKLLENGLSYESPKSLEGAIESKVSLNLANAKLYGDDQVNDELDEFTDGTMTIGVVDDPDDIFAELLGREERNIDDSETDKQYVSKSDDIAPYVGFGHVVPKRKNGKKVYKVEFFPKVKFKPFVADKTTKNDSLTFTTPSIEGTIYENVEKEWLYQATFADENDANAYLDSLFTPAA